MNKKWKKNKIYATFQFLSFIAISCFLGGYIFALNIVADNFKNNSGSTDWKVIMEESFSFIKNYELSGWVTTFLYTSLLLWIISCAIGCLIFNNKKNRIDALFLIFLFLPIFSNIIAFVGQVTNIKSIKLKDDVDKNKIISEQTKIIKLKLINEHQEEINKLIKIKEEKEKEKQARRSERARRINETKQQLKRISTKGKNFKTKIIKKLLMKKNKLKNKIIKKQNKEQ